MTEETSEAPCVDVPSRAAEVQIGMTKDEVAAILGPPLNWVEKIMLDDGASREEAEEIAARIDPDTQADMDTHRYTENCEAHYIWVKYVSSTPGSRDYRFAWAEDGKLGTFVMFSEPLDGPPEDE